MVAAFILGGVAVAGAVAYLGIKYHNVSAAKAAVEAYVEAELAKAENNAEVKLVLAKLKSFIASL